MRESDDILFYFYWKLLCRAEILDCDIFMNKRKIKNIFSRIHFFAYGCFLCSYMALNCFPALCVVTLSLFVHLPAQTNAWLVSV